MKTHSKYTVLQTHSVILNSGQVESLVKIKGGRSQGTLIAHGLITVPHRLRDYLTGSWGLLLCQGLLSDISNLFCKAALDTPVKLGCLSLQKYILYKVLHSTVCKFTYWINTAIIHP